MTGSELKKAERLISTEDILKMGEKIVAKLHPGFDPAYAYPPVEGMEPMNSLYRCQMYVGSMVNLFRRAYYLGAADEELMRITMHRMVLEKAFSDHLNYRQSEIDNKIKELSDKYNMTAFLQMDFTNIERSSKNLESN